MPMRQIRKYSKKSHSKVHKGGNSGRYVLPPSYFGKGMNGYHASGSDALNSCNKQHAVSHGSVSGKWAGPNLYPMMGGNCGCSNRHKQHKYKKSLKTHHKGGSTHKKYQKGSLTHKK